jgi:hypothetical protein
MASKVDTCIRREQAGFRPNRSCIDQICSLRIIIEQSIEWNSPLYLLFADSEKTSESTFRYYIWTALRNLGMPGKIINSNQKFYNGINCQVLHQGVVSPSFESVSGVRQGCLMSPLLFLVVLDNILKAVTERQKRCITWGLVDTLEDLDYADHVCLLSHSRTDMQSTVMYLQKEALKAGLKINVDKTKEMCVNEKTSAPVVLDTKNTKSVQGFTYLGSNVSRDGGILGDKDR